jgi:hypothetical protein
LLAGVEADNAKLRWLRVRAGHAFARMKAYMMLRDCHELFFAERVAGPWQRRRVPLPPHQHITRLNDAPGAVLWLTTSAFPGASPSGQLYRTAHDGGRWNRVIAGDT